MKKIIIEECFLSLISFIIVMILLIVPYYNQNNNNELKFFENANEIKNSEEKNIEELSKKYSTDKENIRIYKINNKYQNVIITKDSKIETHIVKINNNFEVSITELINEEKYANFKELINKEVNIKYPKFIADELLKENTDLYYEFNNSGIIIHFDNYTTNPIYKEKTNITLTCPMIKDYEIYECINMDGSLNPNEVKFDPSKKTVALTFDDGPHKYTTPILETLNNNHMNATFFLVGKNMSGYKGTVKKILEYGNEIGSHSYSHKSLTSCKDDVLKDEIQKVNSIYTDITSKEITLLRPPYGNINDKLKKELDYAFVLWSVDPEDWKYKDVQKVSENVLNEVEDGDIILLHDIHFTTSEALKIILPELYIRGYQVVTVSKLAELKGNTIEKHQIYRNFK